MAAYTSPTDISNRALDDCGARSIVSMTDGSRNATKAAEIYDKLRQEELRANMWVFATRKAALRPIDTTTMLFVPNAYDALTAYGVGDIVSYLSQIWIRTSATTGGIVPVDANGLIGTGWDNYYGPLTVDLWENPVSTTSNSATGTAYHAGELAYLAPGDGSAYAYLSLVDSNTDDPLQADAWVSTTQYPVGSIVSESGILYQSLTNFNIGNDPLISSTTLSWDGSTTYAALAYAVGTDNQVYQSKAGGNLAHNPTLDYTQVYWLPTGMWNGTWGGALGPQPRATSNKWRWMNCTLEPLTLVFPLGTGPVSQPSTGNIYHLPNNFLMRAPNELQLGSRDRWLGGLSASPEDYIFQGEFIISNTVAPIILRFISDFQNVALMDALFCAGLAAKMGWKLCEPLTQKPDLKAACEHAYSVAIAKARAINAIEVGPVELYEDEWIRVRI